MDAVVGPPCSTTSHQASATATWTATRPSTAAASTVASSSARAAVTSPDWAAAHARASGHESFGDRLDEMVAEEARHEAWFSDQCRGHWMLPAVSTLGRWSPAEPAAEAAEAAPQPAEPAID